tara:strand:- start:399 stop:704 length:306 start_codon:yes stop_codon:yes gene_type:complete
VNDYLHHIIHFGIYSILIWQIILGIYLLLKWMKNNTNYMVKEQIIHHQEVVDKKKDLGPIEVDVKKRISIAEVDEQNIKSDEVVKGKVITKKDKLKSLRRY